MVGCSGVQAFWQPAFVLGRLPILREEFFLDQVHHRLEKVAVEPHLGVELNGDKDLGERVALLTAQVGSQKVTVLVLDPGIVGLVKATATREFHAL